MVLPLVTFPDVELVVTGYLRTALSSYGSPVRVSTFYTGNPLEVVVRRDGGPSLDQLREVARLGVNVYAKATNDKAVNDLSRAVSAHLRAMPDGQPVLRVTQSSGPSPIPEASGLTRRYMTFEVYVRGGTP
jgi:hypothetical protein